MGGHICSTVLIIETEIETLAEIEQDQKSDHGISNLSIWQLAKGDRCVRLHKFHEGWSLSLSQTSVTP